MFLLVHVTKYWPYIMPLFYDTEGLTVIIIPCHGRQRLQMLSLLPNHWRYVVAKPLQSSGVIRLLYEQRSFKMIISK